ncbi:hypothetical protein MNB_SV-10-252 [hydrothermal vent metagenome]|uniref:Uncharacterized protein n=1 Tax=hydrothermal vent metagenome TaxID=652676 RepID=A0A1W1CJY2_9ZZZZ
MFCRIGFSCLHIFHRSTFCNDDRKLNPRFCRFHYSIAYKCRRNKDHGNCSICCSNRFCNRIEYRLAQMYLAAFIGRNTTYYIRTIVNTLFRMERALFTCKTLNDYFCIFIYQN